jgi:hypothetical protein
MLHEEEEHGLAQCSARLEMPTPTESRGKIQIKFEIS